MRLALKNQEPRLDYFRMWYCENIRLDDDADFIIAINIEYSNILTSIVSSIVVQ